MRQQRDRPLALVSGASSGIGKATATAFVDAGYRVYNLARRPSGLSGVEDIAVDLADLSAVEALATALVPHVSTAERTCLVHNASDLPQDTALHVDAAAMQHTLRLNVVAPAVINQRLLPQMAAGSSVIFIGSTLSEKGVPGHLSYCAAKHAVVGLMRATCQDLQGRGIHTLCICPGFTATEMLQPALHDDPAMLQRIRDKVGYGRLIEPAEIAALVRTAAEQPVLNGAVLHANLGQRET